MVYRIIQKPQQPRPARSRKPWSLPPRRSLLPTLQVREEEPSPQENISSVYTVNYVFIFLCLPPPGSQEERWQLQIVAKGRVTCPKCKSVSRKTVEGLKKHMENCRLVRVVFQFDDTWCLHIWGFSK